MKYAIIDFSGTQYQVSENDIITVDNLNQKENETGSIDKVLLIVYDKKTTVGTPTVDKASVNYTVIKNHQGEKIRVFKYKAKSKYRKTMGFRAQLTDIKIDKINF